MSLTTYKKQDGILRFMPDQSLLVWTPNGGRAEGSIDLHVSKISNLQQTPASSQKIMLKIFYTLDQADTVTYTFTFISPDAREQADFIKSSLTQALQTAKAGVADAIYDGSKRLLQNEQLQKQVLNADPALRKIFLAFMKMKSPKISLTQAASQFWSSRIHLLREYSINQNQSRGSYNVLAALMPLGEILKTSEASMTITQEQIQLIYLQYPIVEHIHRREVPPLQEPDFWSRFFQSKLFKKLKGLKINASDPADKVLDKYLGEEISNSQSNIYKVPRIFDLEGNQDNQIQQQAVQLPHFPDSQHLMHSINRLSEKILAKSPPSDLQQEEAAVETLLLRDLQTPPAPARSILEIRDQSYNSSEPCTLRESFDPSKEPNPETMLASLQKELQDRFPDPGNGILCSRAMSNTASNGHGCSISARSHIFELLREKKLLAEPMPDRMGFSSAMYDHIQTSHAVIIELLHQFWSIFLSSKSGRSKEIALHAESLHRSKEYIREIARRAEDERNSQISQAQRQAHEKEKRTGQKVLIDFKKISEGASGVEHLFQPTIDSLSKAITHHEQVVLGRQSERDSGPIIPAQ